MSMDNPENINEYQKLTERTASPVTDKLGVAVLCMGLTGEAGEVCDYMKKILSHRTRV